MLRLIVTVVIIVLLGSGGALFTAPNIESWYQMLQKPHYTPPNYLFGPVWTLLYIMMGFALHRLFIAKAHEAKKWFIIQFILNLAWTPVFFGMHSILGGLIIILALDASLIITIIKSYKADKAAAYMLMPYLAWLCFATYLNGALLFLN